MRKRIWELDTLRGVLILLMIGFHLAYDLVYLYGLVRLNTPLAEKVFRFCSNWAGSPFLFLSGLCVTFSSRPVRRGLQVLGCGMVITAVTAGMYFLQLADRGIIIYFGVLQCLGVCMLLWPVFRKLPKGALLAIGIALAAVGLYLKFGHIRPVDFPWLVPFGIVNWGFASSDYFPLLPNLGYFLIGAFLGRTFYSQRVTRFPAVDPERPLIRFFSFFGKHSLFIYMLHQPVLAGLVGLWVMLFS